MMVDTHSSSNSEASDCDSDPAPDVATQRANQQLPIQPSSNSIQPPSNLDLPPSNPLQPPANPLQAPANPAQPPSEPPHPGAGAKGLQPGVGKPFLLPSRFPGRPGTMWFDYGAVLGLERRAERERIRPLRGKALKQLSMSIVCNQNCVVHAFKRAGYKVKQIEENEEALATNVNVLWAKHDRSGRELWPSLKPYQKINHFPGTWGIGRKDNLWRMLAAMHRKHGAAYDFMAKSYLLPGALSPFEADLKETVAAGGAFIMKPVASTRGMGIKIVNKLSQVPKEKPVILQKYISNPLLVNGYKMDLRIYAAVTSFEPLRVYVYDEGLVRFATKKYCASFDTASERSRFMHLTNYSVNKKSSDFKESADATFGAGGGPRAPDGDNDEDGSGNDDEEKDGDDEDDDASKWSLAHLWQHLKAQGVDVEAVRRSIDDVVVKTIVMVEPEVFGRMQHMCRHRGSCFELFGFDVMLDEHLYPWLIEVNISPALSSTSVLDMRIKSTLVTDLLHLVGLQPCDRKLSEATALLQRQLRLLKTPNAKAKDAAANKGAATPAQRRWTHAAEAALGGTQKRAAAPAEADQRSLSGGATPRADGDAGSGPRVYSEAELEHVCDLEEEASRMGHFHRAYPEASTVQGYAPFFEVPRPSNAVLAAWVLQPQPELLLRAASSEARSEAPAAPKALAERLANADKRPPRATSIIGSVKGAKGGGRRRESSRPSRASEGREATEGREEHGGQSRSNSQESCRSREFLQKAVVSMEASVFRTL